MRLKSVREIKGILPDDLVARIMVLDEYDRLKHRATTLEDRLRGAYKYHVWHEENFTDGIHNGSKFRGMIKGIK